MSGQALPDRMAFLTRAGHVTELAKAVAAGGTAELVDELSELLLI